MKTAKGLRKLIEIKNNLPKVGWIFVDRNFDKTYRDPLMGVNFYIPEDDDDEFYGEDHLSTWLEIPTFLAIFEICEKRPKKPTVEDVAHAVFYYLENDDFLE
ncbi:MAG: hypothetical protein F8N15_09035 [Methanobacterium sp.]|nr:hypothetical protein [Methanobacterium sp.]